MQLRLTLALSRQLSLPTGPPGSPTKVGHPHGTRQGPSAPRGGFYFYELLQNIVKESTN